MELMIEDVRRIESATNGAYLGFIEGKARYVIKPALEERGLAGNPFGKVGVGRGFTPGEGAGREALAFAIDNAEGGLGCTPRTELVEIEAFPQMQVRGKVLCAVRDYIVECRAEPNPLDLERIASMDIDEGAADRLEGSLIIGRWGHVWRIDQGLTRGRLADQCVLEWRQLRVLREPMSDNIRQDIGAQDPRLRKALLVEHGLEYSIIALELARIHLKKKCAERNLTFFDISCLLKGYPSGFFESQCAFAEVWKDFGALERLADRVLEVKNEARSMSHLDTLKYAGSLNEPYLREIVQHCYNTQPFRQV